MFQSKLTILRFKFQKEKCKPKYKKYCFGTKVFFAETMGECSFRVSCQLFRSPFSEHILLSMVNFLQSVKLYMDVGRSLVININQVVVHQKSGSYQQSEICLRFSCIFSWCGFLRQILHLVVVHRDPA